ncbi:Fibroblast growth factor 8 precursor, partial [sediment metagenome]
MTISLFIIFLFIAPIDTFGSEGVSLEQSLKEQKYTYVQMRRNVWNEYEVYAQIDGKKITLLINYAITETMFNKESLENLGIEIYETGREINWNGDEE